VASKDNSSKCKESSRISPKLGSSASTSRAGDSGLATLVFLGLLLKDGSLLSREIEGRFGRDWGKVSSTGVVGPEEEEVDDSVESVLVGPRESRDMLGGRVGVVGPASENSDSFEAEKRLRTEKRRRLSLGGIGVGKVRDARGVV